MNSKRLISYSKFIRINTFTLLMLISFNLLAQRSIESMNDGWKFHKGDFEGAQHSILNTSDWESINIPHTWNSEDAYKQKNYYRGIGWYRKNLNIPARLKNKQLYLKFEAALLKADVYINGKWIGEHKGGYTAFSFDVTDHLILGHNNTIAVKVDNSYQDIAPLSGDFTLWGGIYRDIWLIATEKVHFDMNNMASKGVFIETPEVSNSKASTIVRGVVENNNPNSQKVKVVNTISDTTGKVISYKEQLITIKSKSKNQFIFDNQNVNNPELWSPESPYLYTVKTQVIDLKSNKVIDELLNPLGFRWFHFDGKTGFHLNGSPYKLLGVCRHQDQVGFGSALSNDQHRRDMQLIKDLGANFIRISHYPQDDAILEQCDKLGILAWEEIPIVDMVADNDDFSNNVENELREMIRQHYNHPSIIMWGYMNEIMLGTLRKVPKDKLNDVFSATQRLASKLEKVLHEEDPSRPSVVAQHADVESYDRLGLSSISDVLGWNLYQGWYGEDVSAFGDFMDKQHKLHPDRPHIISEYGAGSDKRIHSLEPECFDFSMEYQQFYHEEMMKMIIDRPFIAGSTLWNLIDFGSAFREESMAHINNKGIVYADRTPKDVYYFYKALFNKKPVLHIASRDWDQRAGVKLKPTDKYVTQPVKVYSNLKNVELIVNDQSLGSKEVIDHVAIWDVPFADGKNLLRAMGDQNGSRLEDAFIVDFVSNPLLLSNIKDQFELGVNVGSTSYFRDDQSGFTWVPEKAYEPGSWGYIGGGILRSTPDRIGIQLEIGATHNVPLYQTMRAGLEGFRFDVPKGKYEVELYFTEPGEIQTSILNDLGFDPNKTKDHSIFNLSINGETKIENFNILNQYGAVTAVNKTYIIDVIDSEGVNVGFKSLKGQALLSAIKIRKVN